MDNAPCYNEKEILVTSAEDILKARAEYSAKLASDPTGISPDPTKWTHVQPKEAKQFTLTTPEFLMAIRQMQRNAAPGQSGVLGCLGLI
ncbi:hypothetical protein VP01_7561g1 [Puccinia sorghi]|uniref:Uncharacterized protein n=1 Tax=Puccinia sorghi TaxID=27349 RepID=A0A0L6UC25_9BASI|nr:hypothetical protein VP01_7561g1 [Puccinia sorghi]